MSSRFDIIRDLLRWNATPQPNPPNGDPTLNEAPISNAPGPEPPPADPTAAAVTKTTPVQIVLILLGTIGFLYFARPVVLPIFLACVAGMTLKPLIRWLSCCYLPPALSAALVLCLLMCGVMFGFFQLGRPALAWMNEGPKHMTELRQRVQKIFPRIAHFHQAAAAVSNLGATEEAPNKATVVEVKTSKVPSRFINWTGAFLVGIGETLVLLYLLLASGDLFLQKLVRVMPTLRDKKRPVDNQPRDSAKHFQLPLFGFADQPWPGPGRERRSLFHGCAQRGDVGSTRRGVELCSLLWPRCRGHCAGHRGSAYLRRFMASASSSRLVSGAPSVGSEPHYAGLAGTPLHPESGGHLCFL